MNKLIFADCLDVLKEMSNQNADGFIDLIYIDPPFNSKRDYNVLFESIDMKDTKAQKEAFSDTWSNVSYLDTLSEIQNLDLDLYKLIHTLDNINISKGAVSYLTTMAIRIFYMRKVLKDTGSFYLHCDATMSHYLKIICDLIFGEKYFRNEIIWSNETSSGFKSQAKNKFVRGHDVILFYAFDGATFNIEYIPLAQSTIKRYDKIDDTGKRYKIYFDNDGTERIVYLETSKGRKLTDTWTDTPSFQTVNASREWMGYQTQKPEALLERIIKISTNENDLVADFFCGCGTSIAVAERLKRKWIGVDISHLAIKLIVDRLTKPYKNKPRAKVIRDNIEITGFPRDVDGAKELARNTDNGRFGFQDWIIEVMLGGVANSKKVADGGYDGYLTFYKSEKEKGTILVEVKSGNVNVKNIREFINVVNKQGADLGVFVCFAEQITKPMLHEAKSVGYFDNENYKNKFDKIQILTVEDLLDGKGIHFAHEMFVADTFKRATKKITDNEAEQEKLDLN